MYFNAAIDKYIGMALKKKRAMSMKKKGSGSKKETLSELDDQLMVRPIHSL